MDNKIKWIEQDGERIAIRKSLGAWRVVYPFKDPNGNIIRKNWLFPGGWDSFIKVVIAIFLILLVFYVYDHDTKECRKFAADFADNCIKYYNSILNNGSYRPVGNINLSFPINISLPDG